MSTSSDCYLNLNIDVKDALASSFSLSEFEKTSSSPQSPVKVWGVKSENLQDIFNKKWMSKLNSQGLVLSYALIFYREPNYMDRTVHVDTLANPLRVVNHGVNFVYDEHDDSEMIWYCLDSKDGTIEENFDNSGDLPACFWHLDNFYGKEISRKTIGRNLVLVNTSYPHTVQTFTKPRWSFSLRFTDSHELTWNEALDKFASFV